MMNNISDSASNDITATPSLRYFFTLLTILITIISIFGNGLTCFLIYKKPAMRSAINLFLAAVAASDLLFVILCFPFNLFFLFNFTLDPSTVTPNFFILCDAHAVVHLWLLITHAGVLVLISVDRYVIIKWRRELFTSSHAVRFVTIILAASLFLSLIFLITPPRFEYYPGSTECVLKSQSTRFQLFVVIFHFSLIFLAPTLIITIFFIRTLTSVKRTCVRVNASVVTRKPRRHPINMRFKTKTFSTIVILFIAFLICRMPYAVCLLVMNLREFLPPVHTCVLWWNYSNTALNPIICAWRIRQFRRECVKIIPRSCALRGLFRNRVSQKTKLSNVYYINRSKNVSYRSQSNPNNNNI